MKTRRTAAPTAKAIAFFRTHARFQRGSERGREARRLAWAEAEASGRGWRTEWEGDPDDDFADAREVVGALLRDDHGRVLESRWGIADPDRNTKRVVEAQLALLVLERR